MGLVSCLGNDVDKFYDRLLLGESGVTPITQFPCEDYATRFAGSIKDFDSGDYVEKKYAKRVDKCISYAIVAGKKAVEHAQITPEQLEKIDKERCGVLIGSGMGGMTVFNDGVQTLIEKGHKRITPFFIPFVLTNMPGAMLAMDLGFMGPNYSISTACATSNNAIISAANHIRLGHANLMICGGVEAPILPIGVGGFLAARALSQRNDEPEKASRPWDKARDGFVMGEGAGVLILESLEHALERGAKIYAEYLGGGMSCDAHHMTEPRPDGAGVAVCVKQALADAGIHASQINYINAHATSTSLGDVAEIRAMKQIFTQGRDKIGINSTKSMIGHALGAAGGLEAIAAVKAIETGVLHPTINLENPEEELDFFAPTLAKKWDTRAAISNSFGFGGHNASVIFAPYHV